MRSSWWIRQQGQNTLSRLEARVSELRAKRKCVCPTRICGEDFEKVVAGESECVVLGFARW